MTSETAVLTISAIATSFRRHYSHVVRLEIVVDGLNRDTVDRGIGMVSDRRNFIAEFKSFGFNARMRASKNEPVTKGRCINSYVTLSFEVYRMQAQIVYRGRGREGLNTKFLDFFSVIPRF